MKRLFNSLWILLLAAIGFTLALCFAYLFLFSEELHTNEKSIEDELVADESWIKHVLSTGDHINNQVMYSQKYGQYLYLDKHCNKTITDSKPKFTKLVLIIIDALRVDFVPSIMEPDYSTPRLPYLEQLLKTHGKQIQKIFKMFDTKQFVAYRNGLSKHCFNSHRDFSSSESDSQRLFTLFYGLHNEPECILF